MEPVTRGRRRGHRKVLRPILPLVLVGSSLIGLPPVQAQSPSPPIVGSGDPRSEGEGAGLVGAPFLVAFGVIALGVAASGITVLLVRLRRED